MTAITSSPLLQLLLAVGPLLLIVSITALSSLRARGRARRDWLEQYQADHVNPDNATCASLRAAGWPEDRIKAWCNTNRCVYYSPEYNSTDL